MMHELGDGQDKPARQAKADAEFSLEVQNHEKRHQELMDALKDDNVSLESFEEMAERVFLEADALKHIRLGLSDQRNQTRRSRPGADADDIAA